MDLPFKPLTCTIGPNKVWMLLAEQVLLLHSGSTVQISRRWQPGLLLVQGPYHASLSSVSCKTQSFFQSCACISLEPQPQYQYGITHLTTPFLAVFAPSLAAPTLLLQWAPPHKPSFSTYLDSSAIFLAKCNLFLFISCRCLRTYLFRAINAFHSVRLIDCDQLFDTCKS